MLVQLQHEYHQKGGCFCASAYVERLDIIDLEQVLGPAMPFRRLSEAWFRLSWRLFFSDISYCLFLQNYHKHSL